MTMRWVNQSAVTWALQQPVKGLPRLALVELAAYTNANGISFPCMKTLGVELDVSQRQARRIVSYLVKAGYLIRKARPGRSNLFMISVKLDVEVGHPCPTPPDTHVLPPRTPMSAIKGSFKKSSKTPPVVPRGGRKEIRAVRDEGRAMKNAIAAGLQEEIERRCSTDRRRQLIAAGKIGRDAQDGLESFPAVLRELGFLLPG